MSSSRPPTSHAYDSRRLRWFVAGMMILATFASMAHAAIKTWDGSSSGNWATGANWSGGTAPVAGDDLVFPTGVTQLVVTNDFSPNRAFNSILLGGSNYFLRGDALLITNGITSTNPVGPNTIDADMDVRASQPWEAKGALATLDFNGDINLNNNTLTVRANTGDFFFSGIISGTGNLVKTNVGTLRMDGSGHNTYSGVTRFDGGVLELNKFSVFPASNYLAIAGNLTVGDGNGLLLTDVCRLLADDQIANTSDVTVKNSALFDLNDYNDHIGTLTMQGGTIDTGTGKLFLGGNLTTLTDNNTAFINGNLSLGGASRTFAVNPGPAAPDLQINATISSDNATIFITSGFTKTGTGTVSLAGDNIYNGTTIINDGQVALLTDEALGATANLLGSAPTVVSSNGNLFLSNVQVTNENLTINSINPGGAFNASGASIWTGDIQLNANTFIASSGSFLLDGQITGAGGFTKLSTGSLRLAGTNVNTYTGTTIVRDGALLLDKTVVNAAFAGDLSIGDGSGTDIVRLMRDDQIPDTAAVTMATGAVFDLNDQNETTGAVGGFGTIDLGIGIFRAGADDGNSTFGGLIIGTGSVFKLGTGNWTLSGNNTYSGHTTVSAGTLTVDGSQPLSDMTVNGSANLGGAGVIGNLDVFGSLRPGSSPAILTTSNFVFHSSASDFFVELNGTTSGTGYDQLKVRGSVGLSNATLHATLGFQSAINNSFTIIDNDGGDAVIGTFNGLAQNATVFINGIPFRISYTGGTGNDVVLTQLLGQPTLSIARSGETNVVLSWPTNFTGFTLEANTNLNSSVWAVVVPASVVSGTNRVVTNAANGSQKSYRLRNP